MSEYLVEAGHFYSCNGPSNISLQTWELGKELARSLNGLLALYIDDFHQTQPLLAPDEYFLPPGQAKTTEITMIAEADYVFLESDMAKLSPKSADKLVAGGVAKIKKDVLAYQGHRIGQYAGGVLVPSCVLLDYVLLEQKAKLAANNITVLPEVYEHQQLQLEQLAHLAPIDGLKSYNAVLLMPQSQKVQAS